MCSYDLRSVDSHRHGWQPAFRRFSPNATVVAYGRDINKISRVIRPEDVYIANLSSCIGALDTGVTTMLDWSHISNTPAHSDAAINGLRITMDGTGGGIQIFPADYGATIMLLPFGGFITLGLLIALMQYMLKKSAKKKEAAEKAAVKEGEE